MRKWNSILKWAVVGHLVDTMIDFGYRIQFCDQDGGGLFMYAMVDAKEFEGNSIDTWVKLNIDNDVTDIIVDYNINLEEVINCVNEFVKKFED